MYEQPHTHATWHLADAVDQSEQSIVTVDQSELSIPVKCNVAKVQGCSYMLHKTSKQRSLLPPIIALVMIFAYNHPNSTRRREGRGHLQAL